jgi:hypothetical protein
LEVFFALAIAAVVFIVLKVIGIVIHIALVGAVIGLAAGFVLARAFRQN